MDAKEARFSMRATLKFVLSAQPASRDGGRGERRNKQGFPGVLKSFCPRNQPAGTGEGGERRNKQGFPGMLKSYFPRNQPAGTGGGGGRRNNQGVPGMFKSFCPRDQPAGVGLNVVHSQKHGPGFRSCPLNSGEFLAFLHLGKPMCHCMSLHVCAMHSPLYVGFHDTN